MGTPKVSILLPVYRVEKTLADCLDSLLRQTVQDFEIICVNDASPDGCADILSAYAARDPRIRIVTHGTNRGLPVTRNSGLQQAAGEYILFVDTDDRLHHQTLELTLKAIEQTAADIVAFKAFVVGEEHRVLMDEPHYDRAEIAYVTDEPFEAVLKKKVNVFIWNKLYRRSVFGDDLRFNEQQRVSQDQGILPLIMLRAHRLTQLKNKLYYYFTNDASLSAQVRPWTVTSHVLSGYLFHEYLSRLSIRDALQRKFKRYAAKSVFQAVDIIFSRVPRNTPEETALLDLFVEECRKLLAAQALDWNDFSFGRRWILAKLLHSRNDEKARRLWTAFQYLRNPFKHAAAMKRAGRSASDGKK